MLGRFVSIMTSTGHVTDEAVDVWLQLEIYVLNPAATEPYAPSSLVPNRRPV